MIAEPSRGTEARQPDDCVGCPAGVRARAERPKQLEINGAASDAPAGGGANPPPFLRRSWLWGEDLTGTAPAAVGDQSKLGAGGGVGGLLAVTRYARGDQPSESYWATSDLNGNVIGLLATSSTKTAVYDYDPFGQPIRVNEPEAGLNPVRFSSKYTDAETGLCYYGYRFYSPEFGRWLNRDPIEERGGLNLYGMVGNDAVNRFDYLGLEDLQPGQSVETNCGTLTVDKFTTAVGVGVDANGNRIPAGGADFNVSFKENGRCCCKSVKWTQDVIEDNEPGAPKTPYEDQGAHGNGNTFRDTPNFNLNNLQPLNPNGPKQGKVRLKLKLYCVTRFDAETLIGKFTWGFTVEANKPNPRANGDFTPGITQ